MRPVVRTLRPFIHQSRAFAMSSKFPTLKDVDKLSDRVIRILGTNPGKVSRHIRWLPKPLV
jgi:hypothetical protein